MTRYAWVLWDLLAVLILAVLVNRCAARGFIRTLISFLGYFIAAGAAGMFSPVAARWLYDNIARDLLEMILQSRLDRLLEQGEQFAGSLAELLPAALRLLAPVSGAAPQPQGAGGAPLAQELITALLEQPVLSILRAVSFFVIFALALWLVRRIAGLFTGMYRIPVLGTVNTFFGGLVGVLQGILALYLLGIALQLLVTLTGGKLWWLTGPVLDQTYILRFFLGLSGMK